MGNCRKMLEITEPNYAARDINVGVEGGVLDSRMTIKGVVIPEFDLHLLMQCFGFTRRGIDIPITGAFSAARIYCY